MVAPLTVVKSGTDVASRSGRAPGVAVESDNRLRPELFVIAGRRRATRYIVSVTMVLALAMGGVVFLNTLLTRRQIQINEIDSQLSEELARFDELRAQRAELRAPSRLAPMAQELGMVPVEESEYAEVDPMAYARQLALNGQVPGESDESATVGRASDPMEQYRAVKELIEEGP